MVWFKMDQQLPSKKEKASYLINKVLKLLHYSHLSFIEEREDDLMARTLTLVIISYEPSIRHPLYTLYTI